MFFTPNLVIGLTIMSVGAVLLLDALGIRDISQSIRYWPALIVLFGASIVAQAFRPVDPTNAAALKRANSGVPCFFLFMLAVAMFAANGFPGSEARAAGGAVASATGIMHTATTRGSADARTGRVAAVMGKSSLDLRQVALAPGEVMTVDVFVTMGNARVRIPDDWVVDASALPVMGAIEEERFPRPAPGRGPVAEKPADDQVGPPPAEAPAPAPTTGPPPRLRLRGFVMMGKVEVTS
jgi:hypothetical protein